MMVEELRNNRDSRCECDDLKRDIDHLYAKYDELERNDTDELNRKLKQFKKQTLDNINIIKELITDQNGLVQNMTIELEQIYEILNPTTTGMLNIEGLFVFF